MSLKFFADKLLEHIKGLEGLKNCFFHDVRCIEET